MVNATSQTAVLRRCPTRPRLMTSNTGSNATEIANQRARATCTSSRASGIASNAKAGRYLNW